MKTTDTRSGSGRMQTPNGVTTRLARALALRPAAPGLALLVALLAVTISGRSVPDAGWFWPAALVTLTLSVTISTGVQELRRGLDSRRHRQRRDTAHALLNEHPGLGADRDLEHGVHRS